MQAVRKAEELQPDLILLDIGLPKLNGIEAARQIRKSAPQSRIIFVSQESSPDIVQEALSLGTCGYVVKAKPNTIFWLLWTKFLRAASFSGCIGRSNLLTQCTPPAAMTLPQTDHSGPCAQ
jgi:DNA-binding NarL/FixJ family response regulator